MASARREGDGIRPKLVESSVDERIAALATRQHGVVATRQLMALGLTRRAVSHRAQAGRLHSLHRGVYAVGHADISHRGRWMAAVLAHGDGAVLSHRSAAALWEVLADTAQRAEVTVPTAGGRAARDRVRVHRSPTLRPDEVTIRKRIPVTTPARTVLDLAATLAPRQLERLLDQVEVERLTDYHALGAIAIAHPRHHGSHRLRAMLATHLAGTTVDFLFADRRLIVEIDSWKYHRTRARFDADRRRDATHLAAGHRTLRFTDRQLDDEPNAVAQTTRSALHRRDAA